MENCNEVAYFVWLNGKRGISVGKLGKILFRKGLYFYVGSAQKGVKPRVERHLCAGKKIFWHIDYFLNFAKIIAILSITTPSKEKECEIAQELSKNFSFIERFGSNNCRCVSHLFFKEIKKLKKVA